GVECFFVLSGFILCHVYLPPFEAGRFKFGDFLWARIARIYPLHIATLAAMGLMAGVALAAGLPVDPNVLSLPALPANLTLTQAWGLSPVAGWNHPSWSISAEWFAYLSFPAFAIAAVAMRRWPGVAVAGALALMALLYVGFARIAGFPLTRATISWGALRIIPCFFLGCALFLAWRAGVADSRKALVGAAFFGVGAVVSAQFGAPDMITVAAFGGLIISLAQVSKGGGRVGSHPIFVYLGEISYAVYMVCIPWEVLFVNLAAKSLHLQGKQLPLPLWLFFIVALAPIAATAHHLIEKPARDRIKLWRTAPHLHKFETVHAR
ncbi:MAG TPA: acyltransferase, partial [Caulobacteraceae bacterium]|nr:acyltransferase [Caulobacteraceae bacterium]